MKYAIPYEYDKPIFICRGLKAPFDKVWRETKGYN
jgi:hypothetical protein